MLFIHRASVVLIGRVMPHRLCTSREGWFRDGCVTALLAALRDETGGVARIHCSLHQSSPLEQSALYSPHPEAGRRYAQTYDCAAPAAIPADVVMRVPACTYSSPAKPHRIQLLHSLQLA